MSQKAIDKSRNESVSQIQDQIHQITNLLYLKLLHLMSMMKLKKLSQTQKVN